MPRLAEPTEGMRVTGWRGRAERADRAGCAAFAFPPPNNLASHMRILPKSVKKSNRIFVLFSKRSVYAALRRVAVLPTKL